VVFGQGPIEAGQGSRSDPLADLVDHVELVFQGEAAGTGEADAAVEDVFGDLATVPVGGGVEGPLRAKMASWTAQMKSRGNG